MSGFSPIPELLQSEADLTIAFLSFSGKFLEPVDAPWFTAHRRVSDPASPLEILRTLYEPDWPINSLACTEQHQFCTDSRCSKLMGGDQVSNDVLFSSTLTPKQNVTMNRFINAMGWSTIFSVAQYLMTSSKPMLALDMTATASYTVSFAPPNNQWELEVERWHTIGMAHMQRMMAEYATGQISPQLKYLLPPQTDSERWLCDNLMINSTAFRSFSVLKLTLIVLGASFIIFLSCTIETVIGWLQLKMNWGVHAREMWADHDMLGPQKWREEIDAKTTWLRGSSASGKTYNSSWRHELDMTSLQLYSQNLSSWTQKFPT